ncbi:MAG: hypothetical protein ACOYBE_00330 [Blautia sp.]|jgi:hypothetical protein
MSSMNHENETIQFLSRQRIGIFWANDEARKQVDEIAKARPYTVSVESAADVFTLGYIYGQRAERARRKKGEYERKDHTGSI